MGECSTIKNGVEGGGVVDNGKADEGKNFVWWRKHQQQHVSNFISKSELFIIFVTSSGPVADYLRRHNASPKHRLCQFFWSWYVINSLCSSHRSSILTDFIR
jgi:hypothetical protein